MLVLQDAPITVGNEAVAEKIGSLKFASATYRLFKLPDMLDDEQEDYGQRVVYKGMYGQETCGCMGGTCWAYVATHVLMYRSSLARGSSTSYYGMHSISNVAVCFRVYERYRRLIWLGQLCLEI
jgi:hypothetical protein